MSVPTTLFIDTSVLDRQNYNFSSSALAGLVEAAKVTSLTLLLPNPTEREIARHIEERAREAFKALEDARRRAPFLGKWSEWPLKPSKRGLQWELGQIARQEWNAFLKHFTMQRLAYDAVDLKEIMEWYDYGLAPFGAGSKRKEFPDAFSIAAVAAYAKQHGTTVAVISHDTDLKHACERFPQLLYYDDVAATTAALLESDERTAKVHKLLAEHMELILDALKTEFPDRSFYPEYNPEGDVEDVEVLEIAFEDQHVVGLGASDCTIAFSAKVTYSASVTYDDLDSAIVDSSEGVFMPLHRYHGSVTEETDVSGIAKLSLNKDRDAFESLLLLSVDQSSIAVVETPPEIEDLYDFDESE